MHQTRGIWIGRPQSDDIEYNLAKAPYGRDAVYFRKVFTLSQKPARAVLRLSALGVCKAYLNGAEVGGDFLTPGYTDYGKRVHWFETQAEGLTAGDNALCVVAGDGWYTGNVGMLGRMNYGGYPLAVFAELRVTYADGREEIVATDGTWKCGGGAIGKNDIINGEYFDNRKPHLEISSPRFDDVGWERATELRDRETYFSRMEKADYPPVRVREALSGRRISRSAESTVFDFGQNFAGVCRARIRGKRGSVVRVRHAEMLYDDGRPYLENLRSCRNEDVFVLSGEGEEIYRPTLTYRGFRYAEFSVLQGDAEVSDAEGLALTNALEETGTFETDNALVNRLFSNICWGRRSNFVSVPTDCPQRDERLGWTADAQIFAPTAMYLADCRKFYDKYLADVRDATSYGKVPDCAPYARIFGTGNAAWADAAVILPYSLYRMYGDRGVIEHNLDLMKGHVAHSLATSDGFIRGVTAYGDWLNIDDPTPKEVIGTAYFAESARLLARLLREIGEDAGEYERLYEDIKSAFRRAFVAADGTISGDSQASYLLAAAFGLEEGERVSRHLVRTLAAKNYHIHTGFIGVRFMLPVLTRLGFGDIAYRLLTNDTYPSWGYSIKNGATTCWERWNSYTAEEGFGDAGMNSFNHYALGSCGEWFFEYVLGIRPEKPGFAAVRVAPTIDRTGRINCARGSYRSVRGEISCAWERRGGEAVVRVDNPARIEAVYDFANVTRIVQDGTERERPDAFARHTEVVVKID